jgi:hypothetical protein
MISRAARWYVYIAYQKSQFGFILEGLGLKNVGIFYGHLGYFMVIWYVLWPFGIFCGYLVFLWLFGIFCGYLVFFVVIWYIFSSFGMLYQEIFWNPDGYNKNCVLRSLHNHIRGY